jgi:ferredoxin
MKIHINRAECIECGSCEAICPDVFVVVWDEGSSITKKYRTNEPGNGEIEDDLVDCVREAEENCPVEVISTE